MTQTTRHYAFENGVCIMLPGVRHIPGDCFDGCCREMTRLCVSRSVKTVNTEAFRKCNKLVEFQVDEKNKAFQVRDGYLMSTDGVLFRAPSDLQGEVTAPSGVKEIAPCAFSGIEGPFSLTLREGVTNIDKMAFQSCGGLENIVLPDSLQWIGEQAFDGSGLNQVVLPENVSIVQQWAFRRSCKTVDIRSVSLTRFEGETSYSVEYALDSLVKRGESIVLIPWRAPISRFTGELRYHAMLGFARLYIAGEKLDEARKAEDVKLIRANRKRLYSLAVKYPELFYVMLREKVIPSSDVERVQELTIQQGKAELTAALLDYQEKNFRRRDPVRQMERELVKQEKITATGILPVKEAKELWSYTQYFTDFEQGEPKPAGIVLTLYKGMEEEVLVPRQIGKQPVTAIGAYAFSPESTWQSTWLRYAKDPRAYGEAHKKIRSVRCPDSVVSIEKGAFYGCESLEEFVFPPKVTQVSEDLFRGCRKLARVVLPKGVKELSFDVFDGCKSLKTLVIPEGTERISYSFKHENDFRNKSVFYAGLTDLTIPASVTEIFFTEQLSLGDCCHLTIHAPAGSYAEEYAKQYKIKFEAL